MAKALGSRGVVKVDPAAGTTYAAVAYVKNASFSIQNDEVEVTDNDSSNGWKEFLMGNRSGTFTFTYNTDALYSGGDTEQKALIDEALEAATDALKWQYFPAGTDNDYYRYTFSGFVQEISHDMSNNEVVETTVTVRITGAIVVATAQAAAT
jgi:predicted secreted protein